MQQRYIFLDTFLPHSFSLKVFNVALTHHKDIIAKMERTLASRAMILKFRDESIKKYMKACKEKRDISSEEKDVVIVSIRICKYFFLKT